MIDISQLKTVMTEVIDDNHKKVEAKFEKLNTQMTTFTAYLTDLQAKNLALEKK